jgi:putative membrane protein
MMWHWAPWWQWLWMAGVWIAVIAVIVWAVTALFPNQPRRDPQQILDDRLARGEIDLDEYRLRRDELHAHSRPTDRPGA